MGAPYPGLKEICGVKVEKADTFMEAIFIEEVMRTGAGGVAWALFTGTAIGLPPIIKFASPEMREKYSEFIPPFIINYCI